jgi:hypothetical protein
MIDTSISIKIPKSWGIQRKPSNPTAKYFDRDTLFHTAVQFKNEIILIGPSFYNLHSFIKKNCKFNYPFTMESGHHISWIKLTGKADVLELSCHGEKIHIPVQQSTSRFEGKPAIIALQKDNPIAWINQWIDYYKIIHNIEVFLIYDNASNTYTINELYEKTKRDDIEVQIIDWPFFCGLWGKSDFCQRAAFEHAKFKYLHSCSLVINHDIDELLIKNLTKSKPYIGFRGVWIAPYEFVNQISAHERPAKQRKYKDYYMVGTRKTFQHPSKPINKWITVPKISLHCQWDIHALTYGPQLPYLQSKTLYYGHYMAMNTNWRENRRHIFIGSPAGLRIEKSLKYQFVKQIKI